MIDLAFGPSFGTLLVEQYTEVKSVGGEPGLQSLRVRFVPQVPDGRGG